MPTVAIAIDVAAQHFFTDPGYRLAAESRRLEASELIEYLVGLTGRYPIVSIEDGLAEDDWDSWVELNGALGDRIQVLGDDLFTTNPARLERGISPPGRRTPSLSR